MKGKAYFLTALLTGLGTILFAQPNYVISPATLPDGLYASPYASQTLKVMGGMPPYTFSVSSGQLPAGITLSADGTLSGTPTETGKFSFVVKAKDKGHGPGPHSGTHNYTLTVDPATLTITASNASMTYGGTIPSLTVSYTGFVNGDDATSLKTKPRLSTTATSASPAGTYPTTASGAAAPNYIIAYQNGTMTVGKAPLTITADNVTMTLGGTLPVLSVTYTGFVNGDKSSSLTTLPTISTTVTTSSPAGTYPITASNAKSPNYTFTYIPGTLTINSAGVTVTANAQTKEYGAPDPNLTYTFSGLPTGDSTLFTGSLTRTSGEDVGTYPIKIGSLSAGSSYAIRFTGSFLTITKASQQITWAQNLIVGCNTASQTQLTATASSNLPVTYSVSDPSIATVSGNTLTLLKPGTAIVTAAQPGNADYQPATTVTDTISFQPASLISQHWNDAIFFDNSSDDYIQWQWYKNGTAVAGDTTPYYSETPSLNGQYYVMATNKDGQQVQSCTLDITPGSAISGGIRVSPNPTPKGGIVTIACNYSATALQGAVIRIADLTGKVVQQITNVQPSIQVTMPSANGIYIVDLVLANGQRISTNVLVGN